MIITYFMYFNIEILFKEMKMHLDHILFYFDYFSSYFNKFRILKRMITKNQDVELNLSSDLQNRFLLVVVLIQLLIKKDC